MRKRAARRTTEPNAEKGGALYVSPYKRIGLTRPSSVTASSQELRRRLSGPGDRPANCVSRAFRPVRALERAARGLHVDFPCFLAPMVGLSHRAAPDGRGPSAAGRSTPFTEMLGRRAGCRPSASATGLRPPSRSTRRSAAAQRNERFIAARCGSSSGCVRPPTSTWPSGEQGPSSTTGASR